MDTQQYLQLVLKKISFYKNSEEAEKVRKSRNDVEEILRNRYEGDISIKYAGSWKKGTMIKESYDLDLTAYFLHDSNVAGNTLKEIYFNVKKVLSENGYLVKEKTSALQLRDKKDLYLHIDMVPGRFIDDSKKDVYLYQNKQEKERLQTNLEKHVNYIKDSGLIESIKLLKFLKEHYQLRDVKTFILELFVVEILSRNKNDNLSGQLKFFFKELKENFDSYSIKDPANPEGNSLDDLVRLAKPNLIYLSELALNFIESDNWQELFGISHQDEDDRINSLEKIANMGATPWSN